MKNPNATDDGPNKRLTLRRETVRDLGVRSGIKTGSSSSSGGSNLSSGPPVASVGFGSVVIGSQGSYSISKIIIY